LVWGLEMHEDSKYSFTQSAPKKGLITRWALKSGF
jgi:hypothetical protein